MASSIITGIKGLYTAPNELDAPKGSLLQADNCIIRNNGVLEPRKSQNCTFSRFGVDDNDFAKSAMFYLDTPIINYYNTVGLTYKLTKFGGSSPVGYTFTDFTGNYAPPAPTVLRMKGVEAQRSLFFTTNAGIKVLESLASTPRQAGIGRAADIFGLTATAGGAATALNINSRASYQNVWTRLDVNKRLIVGVPSGYSYASNTSTTQKADVTLNVPHLPSADSTFNFRVYRSFCSLGAELQPSADTYQVWEQQAYDVLTGVGLSALGTTTVTATKANHAYRVGDKFQLVTGDANFPAGVYTVTAVVAGVSWTYTQVGSVTASLANQTINPISYYVTDRQPEAYLGDALYTNASDGDGVISANYQPPLANDVTLWNERVWYGNTTNKYRFDLTLVGIGSPDGVQNNDTITIAGQTYTAKTTLTSPRVLTEFLISATSSPVQKIWETANSLIQAINDNTANTLVNAYLISGVNDSLPKIQIEEKTVGGSIFTVYASRITSWFPLLTTGSSGAMSADNDAAPYRVYFSKLQQPEAVPLLNYLDIGSKSKAVLRVLANQDRLFVIKEDGIFTVSGQAPFRVDLLDDTCVPVNADSFASGGNLIFGFTNQGAVAVSAGGVRVISKQIEDQLIQNNFTDFSAISSCVNERDHQFMLSMPDGTAAGSFVFVYNYSEKAWTRWPMQRSFIAFKSVGTRTLGIYGDSLIPRRVRVEDSAYALGNNNTADYLTQADITNSDPTGKTVSFTLFSGWTNLNIDTLGGFSTGGAFYGTMGASPVVSSALVSGYGDSGTFSFVYASSNVLSTTYSTGNGALYTPITMTIKVASAVGNSPGDMKQNRSVTWLFKHHDLYTATSTVQSDYSTSADSSALTFNEALLQGTPSTLAWLPYINGINTQTARQMPANKRVLTAKDKQRNNYAVYGLYIREAFCIFALNGLQIDSEKVSELGNR